VTAGRGLATAGALACAAAVAGCGFGAGPSSKGTATLIVTRDYGSKTLVEATEPDPRASETVIRLLDREAQITTRYGEAFVQSINGIAGDESGGRRYDWFFYVNGIESPVGAADVRVEGGDRIWWDYRDWTDAMRVPAVVGSWPEPFAQASAGSDRKPVRIECLGDGRACDTAAAKLRDAGVSPRIDRGATPTPRRGTLRVLVGPWRAVGDDGAVDQLRGGPAATGVFAVFKGPIGDAFHLVALDRAAAPAKDLGPRAGLVAALQTDDGSPTWIVTGSAGSAVRRAASLLENSALRDRYAVAAPRRGPPQPLPLQPGEPG
jgi:uncharacterized protein DUF4430